jgi:hypothetical protein
MAFLCAPKHTSLHNSISTANHAIKGVKNNEIRTHLSRIAVHQKQGTIEPIDPE